MSPSRWWWWRVTWILVLRCYVAASSIPEECSVTGFNVTVDEARPAVNYTSILANANSCSGKLSCGNDSSYIVLYTKEKQLKVERVERSGSICTEIKGSFYLKCGSVMSQEKELPGCYFNFSVTFLNSSSLKVFIPHSENEKWKVTVTAARAKVEIVARTDFSLHNILTVNGNFTWLDCYDIYVERSIINGGKLNCCREFVAKDRCYNHTSIMPPSPELNTRTSIIMSICVVVCVVVAVLGVLALHGFRRRPTKPAALYLPAITKPEEVLLVHTKESEDLTRLVKDLAGDIVKHTNIKVVHDIFSTSDPEMLASPQSWVLGKLCSQHTTTVVLVSSPGLSNMMQLKKKGVSDYGMESMLGRDHHPCDALLNTCVDHMLDTHTIQDPGRVLVVRLRGVEHAEAGKRPPWATGHLGFSVVYTVPDNHTELWTALNTPVVLGHQ